MAVSPGKVRKPKRKVSVSLSDEAIKGLERIGVQYGLKLSNMLERAARYYLEEYEKISSFNLDDIQQSYIKVKIPKTKNFVKQYGTVGAVAIDTRGLISVATSSGGITLRLPGRVGDTPLIGTGTYADHYGGVSATGHGEQIMRYMIAFRAVSLMRRYAARAAAQMTMEYAKQHDCACGLIGIDKHGSVVWAHNTRAMSWCYIRGGRLRLFKY